MADKEENKPKVLCDPGWNDPPLFSYDSRLTVQQNSKRTSLTKRVVFPVAATNILPSINPIHTLTPKSVTNKLSPSWDISKPVEGGVSDGGDKEISLPDVMDNFSVIITEVYGEENEKKSSDVRKRLLMMETMWNNGKFDCGIKDKIFQLSEALKGGDLSKADGLQRSLMVDHSSLCSSWMSGIRYLLNSKRE